MWRQGKIYTPLAVLLQLRRISYTGSRLPRAIGYQWNLYVPKRAFIKHSVGKPCMSKAYAKMESCSAPVINTGGSDSRHPRGARLGLRPCSTLRNRIVPCHYLAILLSEPLSGRELSLST